ncbi:unnamed protein product [Pseudo-nitzschia multistriata]|uniref:CAF1B/HIR1 beta-propeller domain-containing protein n=1 Tax=Pseudo-nitzschia multistriata TaxID=183589 RepID=A0A448ZLX7_9STRA|nr:unnamed protein product [Pseudo-nitzschia multistriata]
MKVETPQILWNNEADKGINAPLLSIDILESGLATPNQSNCAQSQSQTKSENRSKYSHVLVTAGNAASINLWKICFGSHRHKAQQSTDLEKDDASVGLSECNSSIFQKQTRPLFNKIDYMMSLNRHDATVNCVAFSPDGLHLATAGDSGNIIIWSVPVNKRGNNNGRHFWSTVTKENDLIVRIVSTHCEGIVDLSWSADSKRFTVGTIDSCVLIYEDKHYGINACSPDTHRKESDWQPVFRNSDQHGSFVQGVAYDPLDVYIASMGGDRTVRVFPRKTPQKSKKKVLRPANASTSVRSNASRSLVTPPPHQHQRMVAQILTEAKIDIGKPKRIKQRLVMVEDSTNNGTGSDKNHNNTNEHHVKQIKHKLFVDESNCESFFRRLNWTVDGAFLVTPAALWHENNDIDAGKTTQTSASTSPLFSTYIFARHRFEEPYRVLTGLDKPSVVVRPNPILFELPPSVLEESKENQYPLTSKSQNASKNLMHEQLPSTNPCGLPYRSLFAVLTLDSILIYDTHHAAPLSVLQGLHYSGLTDCCWSSDGMNLMVCSSDGYISIINFAPGELGNVYVNHSCSDDAASTTVQPHSVDKTEENVETPAPVEFEPLPPCDQDPMPAVLVAPAAKRVKKTRITPTLVSNSISCHSLRTQDEAIEAASTTNVAATKRAISETEIVGEAVTKLSLDNNNIGKTISTETKNTAEEGNTSSCEKPKKKKKRVQPLLISNNI